MLRKKVILLLLASSLWISGCAGNIGLQKTGQGNWQQEDSSGKTSEKNAGSRKQSEDERFETYTMEVFKNQVTSDIVNLHYTLADPQEYGIEVAPIRYGEIQTDQVQLKASAENMQQALLEFNYDKLDVENKITYNVMNAYLRSVKETSDYIYYDEPLGTVSGIQTQLPVVLSEYEFYDEKDVQTYLKLMESTSEYFDQVIAFEKEKSAQGLFMSDEMADVVLEQCQAFQEMGNSNYLYSTFTERLDGITGLTDKEKSDYIQENARMMEEVIYPSYERLTEAIQSLKGTGKNDKGLCYLPEGKEYYELLVKQSACTDRSVKDLQEFTRKQISEDITAMEKVLGIDTGEATGETQKNTDNQSSQNKTDSDEQSSQEDTSSGKRQEKKKSSQNKINETESSDQSENVEEQGKETVAEIQQKAEEVLAAAAEVTQGTAEGILNHLKKGILTSFPELPSVSLEVKYVPEEMQEHLSPAFYMIPAIDRVDENVIYINQAQMHDDLTLFTTLAHEGYPGHLYQTVFFESTDPDPVRNVFHFGGYVEGWATYAEMCSYYLTQFPKVQATILQKNSSVILALYALADMGIHWDGWSRMDAVRFFANYGITDADTVNEIYNLILGSPANYLKYYIGYGEFMELKKEWFKTKGEDALQKEFHEAVLHVGPAPFSVVEEFMWEIE